MLRSRIQCAQISVHPASPEEETLTGDAEDENDKPDDGGSDPKAAERVQSARAVWRQTIPGVNS